ncbi:hypothetical protein BYT27DRAFT_7248033 [Phlegmacium glaucopus]|nr:hypothetical protein BYT27DRAFT_7248033 [Phlegmacium glaucopus]
MEPSKRPTKRRRKGVRRLAEDDDEAADGIAVKTILRHTADGPVEERCEMPVWTNRPPPASTTDTPPRETSDNPSASIEVDNLDFPQPESPPETAGTARTQQYYLQEFVHRVDPMLRALLAREVVPHKAMCGRCPESNIARWRC